ncbi:MAG: tRNA (adenosine(37)-N6)-threonylcarbamoyltransferase complex ATPase subunit type 1 TsaE [Chloroflexi bacterium]|nr:tRNA (adenosine(37)-N6)-threonylcarbamoyltransferase complex ATPase subunit type 1 TsaE [Chloroflexota bacterium]
MPPATSCIWTTPAGTTCAVDEHTLVLPSRGPGETRRLGRRLGRLLRPGDVVLLSGELGAGKTVFVQGVARGLGYEGAVSSKSFILLGEYPGRTVLYHADLYRLEAPEQAEELALDEICGDGALVVEWPERAPGIFPPDHLSIAFEATGERTRTLVIEAHGPNSTELWRGLERHRVLKGAASSL